MRAQLRSGMIFTVLAMGLGAAMCLAQARSPLTFNLPPQPLGQALRAVARVTHTNIVFDPAVVAGLTAPALKGPATASEALTRLLAQTRLRCIRVGVHTVRIARRAQRLVGTRRGPVSRKHVVAGGPGNATPRASASRSAGTAAPKRQAVLSEVVVTGTRIVGAVPVSPVLTFDRAAIDASGYGSVGAFLLTVPENFGGGQNPGVIGARGNNQFSISGASSANLFGLGADSTLTLVDGHRLAYDAYQNGVDLSLIPLAAVSRIEILADGASAIYGSDAVAGVVNVILKHHFNGVTAAARYGDVTSGEASRAQYSVLAGHNWASGNALVAYEYAHDRPLRASQRPFSSGVDQPFDLLPELNRNSVFLTAHQDLLRNVTASVDALYTARSYVNVVTVRSTSDQSIDYADVGVKEYGVSPAITARLPHHWQVSLEGTLSGDRDNEISPAYSALSHRLLYEDIVDYRNDLQLAEVNATGPVFRLPAGPVKIAVGAGLRYESFDTSTPTRPSAPMTRARRDVHYAYLEADVPLVTPNTSRLLLQRLRLSAAFRYEHYSDFGAQHSPKVGLLYRPARTVALRATWSESFRAPELLDVYGTRQLYLEPSRFFGGAAGTNTLIIYGSNPALGPETASSRTVSVEITPTFLPRLKVTPTYFDIRYNDRLVQPIEDFTSSLANPANRPFVVSAPTLAEQQALIASSGSFTNYSGAPYDPATVGYILNDAYTNATVQKIHGVDVTVQDAWHLLGGGLRVTANGAWLTLRQQTIPGVPEVTLSGTIFNPPRFKGRATATWQRGGWALTAALNYVSSERDNSRKPAVHVASWSTVDAQVSYDFSEPSPLRIPGLTVRLSVRNLLDRDPPFVAAAATTYAGLGYDSTNASPLGRFISLDVSKTW